ncbi:Solute carrier family 22 member 21 [Nymphon striatum]|nr:Solute carrier family 22 member 21 [Nymphon striatum]
MTDHTQFTDQILELVGHNGPFQAILVVYLSLIVSPAMDSGVLQHIMFTLVPDHWCRIPDLIDQDIPVDVIKHLAIPVASEKPVRIYEQCKMFVSDGFMEDDDTHVIPCSDGWEYNYTLIYKSMTSEASIFYFRNDSFKQNAHRFGRKPAIMLSFGIAGIGAFLTTIMQDFYSISAVRFIAGFPYWSLAILPYFWVASLPGLDNLPVEQTTDEPKPHV